MNNARSLISRLHKLSRFAAPVRILVFVLVLLVLWLPLAGVIYWVVSSRPGDPEAISNTLNILTILLLYVEFLMLVYAWGRWVHRQPHIFQHYGLDFSHSSSVEALIGLALGVSSLFMLFLVQSGLGWVTWRSPAPSFGQTVLEGLLVALGLGFAEELLFRGWLLDELQRDYRATEALWISATIYAVLHGIKPQFPALVLLGMALVWAKWATRRPSTAIGSQSSRFPNGRLALPIGLHAGLVWGYYIVNVGKLVEYTNRISPWVTGIDGNPLAGIMGGLFLGALAVMMQRLAQSQRFTKTK